MSLTQFYSVPLTDSQDRRGRCLIPRREPFGARGVSIVVIWRRSAEKRRRECLKSFLTRKREHLQPREWVLLVLKLSACAGTATRKVTFENTVRRRGGTWRLLMSPSQMHLEGRTADDMLRSHRACWEHQSKTWSHTLSTCS